MKEITMSGIDVRYIERLTRNLLTNWFGSESSDKIPTTEVVIHCIGEWGLDIQDIATVLRILSGEATEYSNHD